MSAEYETLRYEKQRALSRVAAVRADLALGVPRRVIARRHKISRLTIEAIVRNPRAPFF